MINIIVIRDLQIKTTIRCHCTLLECLKSQLLITPHAGKDVKQQELSLTADENANGTARDFPGGPVVKNLPANAVGHRFDPCSGKIPHAIASMLCNKKNHPKRRPCAAGRSSPYSLLLEKAGLQQRRPRTVKNK